MTTTIAPLTRQVTQLTVPATWAVDAGAPPAASQQLTRAARNIQRVMRLLGTEPTPAMSYERIRGRAMQMLQQVNHELTGALPHAALPGVAPQAARHIADAITAVAEAGDLLKPGAVAPKPGHADAHPALLLEIALAETRMGNAVLIGEP